MPVYECKLVMTMTIWVEDGNNMLLTEAHNYDLYAIKAQARKEALEQLAGSTYKRRDMLDSALIDIKVLKE